MKRFLMCMMLTVLVSPVLAEQKLRPAKHKDFLQIYDDMKLEETSLRSAYEKHVGQGKSNGNVVSMKTRKSWGRASAEFNQGMNAILESEKVREQWKYEKLLNCKDDNGIKCKLVTYHSSLKELWGMFNRHLSGRTPSSQKELKQVESIIRKVKKGIELDLQNLKKDGK